MINAWMRVEKRLLLFSAGDNHFVTGEQVKGLKCRCYPSQWDDLVSLS